MQAEEAGYQANKFSIHYRSHSLGENNRLRFNTNAAPEATIDMEHAAGHGLGAAQHPVPETPLSPV